MFRKISIAIALAICLTTLPFTALAAGPAVVYQGNGYTITATKIPVGDHLPPDKFTEGMGFVARSDWKAGFVDTTGKIVIPIGYATTRAEFSEGLGVVCIDGKWGFMDNVGKVVIPIEYNYADIFSEGLAPVWKGNKCGYINKSNEVVIPFEFDNGRPFSEGLARVEKNGAIGYIDKSGEVIVPFADYMGAGTFQEGMAMVSKGYKDGFIDKTGKVVIPLEFDLAYSFSCGMATVMKNGKWGAIDKTGKVIVPLKYDVVNSFSEDMAVICQNDKYGVIDKTGKVVAPPKYDSVADFSEGLAVVEKDRKYGYIDKTGKVVIPINYEMGNDFSEGLAFVYKDNKGGIIDKTGKVIIPFKYTAITRFSEGFAVAQTKTEWFMLKKIKTPAPIPTIAAKPTPSIIVVNGVKTAFDAYSINENNFFKLRDLAYSLSGSDKQFEVAWDEKSKMIQLISNTPYTSVGGEMQSRGMKARTAVPTASKILLDGKEIKLAAYNIGGDNYFKLRDIGQAFDFGVDWDGANKTIYINTAVGYSE